MNVLVLNCGSSSLKYQLIDMNSNEVLCSGLVERIGEAAGNIVQKSFPGTDRQKVLSYEEPFADHTAALQRAAGLIIGGEAPVVADASGIGAIGHRVVHGGEAFRQPALITAEVKATIERFCKLAPLHNPAGLMGINAATALFPGVPQAAVFDTAFHGTSHGYVAKKAAQVMGKPFKETSAVTVHLGNGCSMAAVKNGRCIDTSMGLTPLMGLMMGTRSGDVDPSLHAFLSRTKDMDIAQVDNMLNKESGLKGICGVSDMRDIHAKRGAGDKKAQLAFEMFAYRVKHYIGAYLAALDTCDAIVFTAGIGENDPDVRQEACNTLGGLGVKIDRDRNYGFKRGEITKISTDDSAVTIYVIPTNEELEIATQTYSLLNGN